MNLNKFLKSVRPSILSLPAYYAGKTPAMTHTGRQIKLSSNENRYGPSPKVLDALKRISTQDLFLYPDPYANALREALVCYWKKHDVSIENNEILFGDGSGEVLDLIFAAFLSEGDTLVIPEKSFSLYRLLSLSKGANVIEVSRYDNEQVNLNTLKTAVVENHARMVVFSNPDNPTSTFSNPNEIEWFLQNIPSETLVIIDEAYIHFESLDLSSIAFLKHYPNLIVSYTFSKAYALASLRVGYAVMNEQICNLVQRVRLPFNLGYLPQMAALQALEDETYLKDMLKKLVNERERLYQVFLEHGYKTVRPHGNFIFVRLNATQSALPDFLAENGVSVRNLKSFGYQASDIRVTVGTEEDNQILVELMQEYKRKL